MTIGVFDSGVGGLWVLTHIQEKFSEYDYIYVADQIHVPYGSKSDDKIKDLSEEITNFLIKHNCKIIILACNTASTASLKYLRNKFPGVYFIGMEPAVKPAVENSKTNKVGILATPTTFQGELYSSLIKKFGKGIKFLEHTCSGLVEEIEKGELDSPQIIVILEKALSSMVKKGIDHLILGCTHYPFVILAIRKIIGDDINIIDPTPAIVRQVGNILNGNSLVEGLGKTGKLNIFTSGDVKKLNTFILKVFNKKVKAQKINWDKDSKLIK